MNIPDELKDINWKIMPVEAIRACARVMEIAAPKKGDHWKTREGRKYSCQLGHATTHQLNFEAGHDWDDDGESNLAHEACRIMLALQHQLQGTAIDDRQAMYRVAKMN